MRAIIRSIFPVDHTVTTLEQNNELIKYYLRYLKLRKEEFIKNYQPDDFQKLTDEEKIQLGAFLVEKSNKEKVEARIVINFLINEYRLNKIQKRKERSEFFLKSIRTISVKDTEVPPYLVAEKNKTSAALIAKEAERFENPILSDSEADELGLYPYLLKINK